MGGNCTYGTFKTSSQAEVWWWAVKDVFAELQSMLNDLGNYDEYRAILTRSLEAL